MVDGSIEHESYSARWIRGEASRQRGRRVRHVSPSVPLSRCVAAKRTHPVATGTIEFDRAKNDRANEKVRNRRAPALDRAKERATEKVRNRRAPALDRAKNVPLKRSVTDGRQRAAPWHASIHAERKNRQRYVFLLQTRETITIRLRRPHRWTPPSAHSRTCRSSSDHIRSFCPRVPMIVVPFPPYVAMPPPRRISCGLLRAASSAPHSLPDPVCLARLHRTASSSWPARSTRPPHQVGEPRLPPPSR
jgi:hypothetical protein